MGDISNNFLWVDAMKDGQCAQLGEVCLTNPASGCPSYFGHCPQGITCTPVPGML